MIDLLADCKSKVYNGTYGKFLYDDSILMPEDKKLKDSDYPYPHVLKEKIRDLQKYYPWKVRVHELEDKVYGHIPSTVEGLNGTLVLEKSIQVVEVTYDFNKTKNKPGIVVFSVDPTGISIPSAMILLIYNLLEKCESKIPLLLKLNWYFIPLGNPHGFYYNTVTVPNLSKDQKPLAFRKNRRMISTKYGKCFGVNIDRNFDYHWGEGDFENGTQVATSDGVGCDEFYAGPSAFSESESVALRNFFLQKKEEVKLYIQLQTRLDNRKHASIEYPWTYTKEPPPGVQSLVEMATCAQKLIHYNTKLMFKVRQASKRLQASGTILDWLSGKLGAKLAYSIKSSVQQSSPIDADSLQKNTQMEFTEFKGGVYALASQLSFPMATPKSLCIPKWANIEDPKTDVKKIARIVEIKGLDLRSGNKKEQEIATTANEIRIAVQEMEKDVQGVSDQVMELINKLHIKLYEFID
ncbi:zinc carboxypeptidase A 1-like isoform X2 [Periplaneta americana]